MRKVALLTLLLIPGLEQASYANTQEAVTDSVRTRREIDANEPGTVFGIVRDGEDGKALPYTNIVFLAVGPGGRTEQVGGTMAVGPGQYWATMHPGRYQLSFLYLGYEKFTTEPFDLGAAQQIKLDVELKVRPIEMEMIAIQAAAITNTEFSQLERQRKAVAVQDAITAEQISRSTDSNVAEALERVTGLSVVGGKFVYVRGLGDRYSSTSLNGASLSSPEPSRRTVPLDIFPSAMLDNVVIQKAYTPDMPGEFGGGNIDVRTREAIDKRQFNFHVKAGLSSNVLDNGYHSYAGGRLDWLGRDDGTRSLPSTLDPWADSKLPGKKSLFAPGGLEVTELSAIRESFSNVWTPRQQADPVDFGYSAMYADKFAIGGRTGSILLASSLSNSFNTRDYEELDYRGGSAEYVSPRTSFDVQQSDAGTLLGATAALNFRPWNGANISYNFLHTNGSEDKARTAEGLNDADKRTLQHSLTFIERQLDSHVLQTNVVTGSSGSALQLLGSYSAAERHEPDRRFSEFTWVPETIYDDDDNPIGTSGYWGNSPLQFPFQRVFGDSDETDRGAKANYDWRLPASSFSRQGLKFGWEIRDRDRSTAYRRFGISCQGCEWRISDGQGENVFDRSLYDDPAILDKVIISESTTPADTYDAGQQVAGYFAMADVDLWERFRIVGGARYEESRQYVNVLDKYASADDAKPQTIRLARDNVLPAVNGTWRLTERANFRLGYSKTLNRPEMRELSPFKNFNYESNLEEQGNAYLDQTTIDSWDARLEAYPGLRRYMAVSGFYKTFDAPIERILSPQSAGNLKEVPGNGDAGELYGTELEWRGSANDAMQGIGQVGATSFWLVTRPFWVLGQVPGLSGLKGIAPRMVRVDGPDYGALRNFGFTANYSWISSETTVNRDLIDRQSQMTLDPERGLDVEGQDDDNRTTGPLTGQSSHALNLGVYYGNGRSDVSLMLKDFGDRLYAYGVGTSPDVYERVPMTLDLAVSQRFGGNLKLRFTAENLLNQTRAYAYDKQDGQVFESLDGGVVEDPVRRSWVDGRRFALALSWSL